MTQFYGKLTLNKAKDEWKLWDIDPHVMMKFKNLFTKVPKVTARGVVRLNRTLEISRDIEWFVQRYPFNMNPGHKTLLVNEAKKHRKDQDKLAFYTSDKYVAREVKFKDGEALRPHQNKFVDVFRIKERMINGDDVGLGKTVQCIGAAMSLKGALPALIVMEPHLQTQWRDEVEFFTDLKVHMIMGQKNYDLPEADIYLMKYSCIGWWSDRLRAMKFPFVAFDEIQELRRSGSSKYDASAEACREAQYVSGYSATPIYNYGDEIWNIYNIIAPGTLGRRDDFEREWCTHSKKVTDPIALGTFLQREHLFLRRTKKDVGQNLAEPNRIIHTVDYDKKAIERIEERAQTLAIKALQGTFIERGQASRDLDMMVRHATGVSKARHVANYIKPILDNGEKVLLAGWHRDVYDIWNKELESYNPVMYTGSENPVQKDRNKKKFIEGDSQLMFISLRSGKGLDGLQKVCSYVVIGELDWSPGVHHQLIGRLDRDGQETQVTAIFLMSDSGSDPVIVEMLGIKSHQSQGIVNPFQTQAQEKTYDDSRVKMLAKKYAGDKVLWKEQAAETPTLATAQT